MQVLIGWSLLIRLQTVDIYFELCNVCACLTKQGCRDENFA
jgi:hypothetical protein